MLRHRATAVCSLLAMLAVIASAAVIEAVMAEASEELSGGVRIVGGDEVAVGGRPYQAAVYVDTIFLCSGSLIDPSWVMTGAGCVLEGEALEIVLGVHNMTADAEDGRQYFSSTTFLRHQNFSAETKQNDIALVKLPEVANITATVKTVSLPPAGQDLGAGVTLVVSGWGTVSDDSFEPSPVLRQVSVASISNEECTTAYNSDVIHNTTLCTSGSNGKGTCGGDGGGPLTELASDGTMCVRGITSFGHVGGCQQGYPDGFTRVSHYLDWITDTMSSY